MSASRRIVAVLLVAALAAGCATVPAGPSVAVMPGSAKSFEQFQADDATCRQWAEALLALPEAAGHPAPRAGALFVAGWLAMYGWGEIQTARGYFESGWG